MEYITAILIFLEPILEEDLTTDLMVLQSHLDGVLDRVHSNGNTLRRFQMFEMGLLNINSLADMLEYVLNSQDFFDLDYIGFCLMDPKGELKKILVEDGIELNVKSRLIIFENDDLIQSTFGHTLTPYIGSFRSEKCTGFFISEKYALASVTITPLIRREKVIGALCMGSLDSKRFVNTMSTDFIEHMTLVLGVCLENHISYETMNRTSLVDPLTGVNNRRFLEQRLGEEIHRAQRSAEALSCFFLDIDFFKKVNDTYGHQVGDEVLKAVAGVIREQLRNNDVLARYGGEEFIALLANIEESMGMDIAERIRKKVRGIVVESGATSVTVTISIGCVTYKPARGKQLNSHQIGADLIHKADEALYKAKEGGRNRVISAGIISDQVPLSNLFK